MNFASAPLWVGVGASLLLLALMVALYLLRPPPRAVLVPSTLLWERVLEEQPPRKGWLRWLLSLLLSTLVALSILWALLGLERSATGSRALFLVVDNSATLATRTATGERRIDAAVDYARRRVAAGAGELYLADTTGQIGVQRPSRERAFELLEELEPRFAHRASFPPLPNELDLERAEVVLVTDGVAELGEQPPGTRVVSVFEQATNVGILTLRAARSPGHQELVEAFLEIANASSEPASPTLRVGPVGSPPVLERTLELSAGEVWSGLLDLGDAQNSRLWIAELELDGDALATDDRAWLWQPTERSMAVTLVGRELTPLHRALLLNQEVELRRATPEEYAASPPGSGVVVFEGTSPQQRPQLPSLLIAPGPAPWLPPLLGDVGPVALDGAETVAGLDLVIEDLEARTARRFDVADSSSLLDGSGVPLLFRAPKSDPRDADVVVLAFSVSDSNLALKWWFPVLLSRLLSELTGEEDDAARVAGLQQVGTVSSLRGPAGDALSLLAAGEGSLADLDRPGVYRLGEGERAPGRPAVTRVVEPIGAALTFVNRSPLSEAETEASDADLWHGPLRPLLLWLALGIGLLEVGTRLLGLTE